MPGTSSELEQELDPNFGLLDDTSDELLADWCPPIFLQFLEVRLFKICVAFVQILSCTSAILLELSNSTGR